MHTAKLYEPLWSSFTAKWLIHHICAWYVLSANAFSIHSQIAVPLFPNEPSHVACAEMYISLAGEMEDG